MGEEDRLRRVWGKGRLVAATCPFSPFRRSGWLPACVGGCVVTSDPAAGGLQWQRQL